MRVVDSGGDGLRGRTRECGAIEALVARARQGKGGSLLLRGEPGIGKTALVEYAAGLASELQVVHAVGVESEMEMPYAALQQLCSPLLDHLDQIPVPQADALATAFGLRSGGLSDRFLVYMAALSLLSAGASAHPMLCLVDDAQWIEVSSLEALAFASRRVGEDALAIIFTSREPVAALSGLNEIVLRGLTDHDAREMLATVVPGRLDERVRERILVEARGNPLALLELPHGRDVTALAGGFGLPTATPLSNRIEDGFLSRVRALPATTQQLLLVASAEPLGDPVLLARACSHYGARIEDAGPAERDGLFQLSDRAAFRHPLVRSAVYKAATAQQRQDAHRALAEATDPAIDPDRRAWHRAHATFGPDDEVADDLERSAAGAHARGGPAAAAAFLEAAATLSSDPARRARLMVASAEARYFAGAMHEAAALLDRVDLAALDELHQVLLDQMRARIQLGIRRAAEPFRLMMQVARRLESVDADASRSAYLDALMSALVAGIGNLGDDWAELGKLARGAPQPREPGRPSDALLDGMALQITDGYVASLPQLRCALVAIADNESVAGKGLVELWLASRSAMNLWEDELWFQLSTRLLAAARELGVLMALPTALSNFISVSLLIGDLPLAGALLAEVDAITEVTGSTGQFHGTMALAAWRGLEQELTSAAAVAATHSDTTPQGVRVTVDAYTHALLYNGLGRYSDALLAAQRASARPDDLSYALWALPELVEAASRCGEHKLAMDGLAMLQATTIPAGTNWGLGVEARCRALTGDGTLAESAYEESLELLGRTRFATQIARSHLVYGEWLRRENRRVDARDHLRKAQSMFSTIGATGFALRAERELAATGERARSRRATSSFELTPQELQIAHLAADGLSNSEIGTQLFISPRTVEYHLHKVFAKLGIDSRNQLNRVLSEGSLA